MNDGGARASSTAIPSWLICPGGGTTGCSAGGEEVSRPQFIPAGWLEAPARSTVIAALIADGRYPGIERSTNLRDLVDAADFAVPWWYRSDFAVQGDARTSVHVDGILHKADVFVNGHLVATADEVAGAYASSTLDVTGAVAEGTNTLAPLTYPGNPLDDLTIKSRIRCRVRLAARSLSLLNSRPIVEVLTARCRDKRGGEEVRVVSESITASQGSRDDTHTLGHRPE